jgi:DEAD/DEAH box helicase domain-containing protein
MGFDYPVLSGYTGVDYRRSLPTLDLLEEIEQTAGRRIGLARLAQATFGADKSADGLQSLQWYREGRLDLIEEYCRRDVELLRDLYLFGRREGHVCWTADEGEETIRIPVDWR